MGRQYLVISDNHGDIRNMKKVLKKFEGKVDGLIHCGDLEFSVDLLEELVDCPVWLAVGNCDYIYDRDPETVFSLDGHNALVTHGHRYDIRWGTSMLLERALDLGVDLVFFGHSHRPAWLEFPDEKVSCFNPGSIFLPRQFEPFAPTFMTIGIEDDGSLSPTWYYLGHMNRGLVTFEVEHDIIRS